MAKTNRQSRKTKIKIKNALMELTSELELSKITINQLTEQADISRRTFYLHYTDFKALLSEIESENMELVKSKVLDKLVVEGELDLFGFYDALNDMLMKDNKYFYSDSKSAYSLYLFNKIEEVMIAEVLIKNDTAKKTIKNKKEMKVTFFITGSMKVFWLWINEGRPGSLRALVNMMMTCFDDGYDNK